MIKTKSVKTIMLDACVVLSVKERVDGEKITGYPDRVMEIFGG